MTLRHLLTHSSGLKPWRGFHELLLEKERKTGERLIGTPAAREFVIERMLRSALVHEPGAAAVYGDLDFIVLGARGRGRDAPAARRLRRASACSGRSACATPSSCRTGDGVPACPRPLRRRIAATENCPWRERIVWGEVHDPNASVMGGVAGHAGLFATADDVMRFAQTILDVWHGRSDALPRELLRTFLTRQHLPDRLGLGARLGHADPRRVVVGPALLASLRSATSASRAPRSGSISSARRSW